MIKWHVKAYIVIRYVHKLVTIFEKVYAVTNWSLKINSVNELSIR